MGKSRLAAVAMLFPLFLAACDASADEAALDVARTEVAANLFATQTAGAPTIPDTATTTPTPTPTQTVTVTTTAPPWPTDPLQPLVTPEPT